MNDLIIKCNEFMKGCQFPYAFCGGYALELFIGKAIRPHSDIDISIFSEDRKNIVEYFMLKGWRVYGHTAEGDSLRQIINPEDEWVLTGHSVWAIHPGCSFVRLEAVYGREDVYQFKILDQEQRNFDFIEVIFNKKQDTNFICHENILRKMDKAILYDEDIPYLSPELILLFKSHPAYATSDYHKDKYHADFNAVAAVLSDESRAWLIKALKTAYPGGHEWVQELENNC